MEDDDFFEQFKNRDLSSVKKFNFKQFKAAKTSANTFPALKSGVSRLSLSQSKNEVKSTKTFNFDVPSRASQPKLSLQRNEETTSNRVSPTKTAKGVSYPNKLDLSSKNDTILDNIYKNTISNKKGLESTQTKKLSPSKLFSKDAMLDSKPKRLEQLFSTKQNALKSQDLERSPSLLSGRPKLTSKDISSVSKYFNGKNTTDSFKSSVFAPRLTPFRKLLDNKIVPDTAVSDRDLKNDRKPESDVSGIIKNESKPITISDSSSSFTDSPEIRPKQFVFKKKSLETPQHSNHAVKREYDHSSDIKKESEPILETVSSGLVTDSSVIKPKKFVFKKENCSNVGGNNCSLNEDIKVEYNLSDIVKKEPKSISQCDSSSSALDFSKVKAESFVIKKENLHDIALGEENSNHHEKLRYNPCGVMKKVSEFAFETSKPGTISDSSIDADSPVIKPKKKFVFKKKLSSSSISLTLSQEKTNFNGDLCKNLEENKNNQYNDHSERLSASRQVKSSAELCKNFKENKDIQYKESSDRPSVSRQSVSSAESLEITDGDYMDDEEFERRFGSIADEFDDRSFNQKDQNVSGNRISTESQVVNEKKIDGHSTEELLNEISTIKWDDNFFEDEPVQKGFKDRDDDSDEFRGNYEHSEVMLEVLHQKFGLRSFRPHQREVINASLTQHDCFVLMPTGGGKSLCYQLPAVLMPGVTVVISPLRALISDQVDKLNALDISAAHLCADVSKAESEQIYMKLSMREPGIKLLYLTPEKICASRIIIDMLNSLYQRGKLARFVIDEVHCLSQWGHDFRPDYKNLSMLRKNYKDVPIICLTATATKQVEQDVINILSLRNVKRFIRSFNRPNIKYQVFPKKGKETIEEIANLIKSKFQKKSGIVYCLGRKDCDNLAEQFNHLGIKSKPYHAGMNDKVREVIQREWMQDRFHVIVATIAFGMGIDKPDVRFVIHNSVPKSVEAFYQESGRAGRDGEVSYSYLYYSYADVARLQKLMQMDRNVNKKTLDAHKENLKQMVSFAENVVDCRRHLQLIHLGEHFDRRICIRNKETTCDNCENIDKYKTVEVTKEAKELCTIVRDLTSNENVTMLYVVDVYRGSKIKKILSRGHNKHKYYGAGASMDKTDVQRILKEMLLKHILNDFCAYTGEFPVVYIKTGPKFYQFFNSDYKLSISVCTDKPARKEVVRVSSMESVAADGGSGFERVDSPKPSTSGVIRHTVQKQATAKLQAARKLQVSQLKVTCHEELLEECRRLAMERNLTLSSIMNLSAIKTMSENLPNSKEEMLRIQHVTNANYNKYGEFFLKITTKFREKYDALAPLTLTPAPIPAVETAGEFPANIPDDPEFRDDFDFPSSQRSSSSGRGRGVKRKGGWSGSWGGKKRKGGYKRKKGKSPAKGAVTAKKAAVTAKKAASSGWKGKKEKGGGGLGLLPLHIK